MNGNELLELTLNILGGLAALLALGVFVVLLGKLGDILAWLGKTAWGLVGGLGRRLRSPRQTLLEGVKRSTLFAFALFPFTWFYEKLWLRPKLKRIDLHQSQVEKKEIEFARPIPAALTELMRLWQCDSFDLQPIADLPGSKVYPLSVFMHAQLAGAAPGTYVIEPLRTNESASKDTESVPPEPVEGHCDSASTHSARTGLWQSDDPRWRMALWRGPGNNDVPEGELTELQDLLDLGLPSFERRHVFGLEFDEAELMAWWAQEHFNTEGEMTLSGWLRVSELTMAYCDAHRYPIWRFAFENHGAEARKIWLQGLINTLAAYHAAVLHVRCFYSGTGSGENTVTSASICLWREEIAARYRPLRAPSRNWTTFKLTKSPADWNAIMDGWIRETQPIRLIDLLQSEAGADALVNRLDRKIMPPYTREELAQAGANGPRWVWAEAKAAPVCLLLDTAGDAPQVRFPAGWAADRNWAYCGPLQFKQGRLKVTDKNGLSGLVDMEGRFTLPCCHSYLDEHLGAGDAYEAADRLVLDNRGEVLCDLIDGDGKRINPPGLKVLAGTLHANGCVVATENSTEPLRLDWMDTDGVIRAGDETVPTNVSPIGLRWQSVCDDSERRRPVQSPENNLWGYLDETGAVAIAPKFTVVGGFHQGLALASHGLTNTKPDKFGLIDPMGNWALPPEWANIWPESRRCWVVEDASGRVGAIDPHGKVIVPLRPRGEILAERDELNTTSWQEENELTEAVMHQWRLELKKQVDAALQYDNLAALEGVFDADASESDLRETGVWHMPVRIKQDQTKGILQPKAGETGHIFTQYPVSLATFNLSVEAPVAGLATKPDAIIGVPWRDLAPASLAFSREKAA